MWWHQQSLYKHNRCQFCDYSMRLVGCKNLGNGERQCGRDPKQHSPKFGYQIGSEEGSLSWSIPQLPRTINFESNVFFSVFNVPLSVLNHAWISTHINLFKNMQDVFARCYCPLNVAINFQFHLPITVNYVTRAQTLSDSLPWPVQLLHRWPLMFIVYWMCWLRVSFYMTLKTSEWSSKLLSLIGVLSMYWGSVQDSNISTSDPVIDCWRVKTPQVCSHTRQA